MSIRSRLAATFVLIGIGFVAIFGGLIYGLYSSMIYNQLDDLLNFEIIHLREYIFLDEDDYLQVRPIPLTVLGETEDELVIQVWDINGRLIYQSKMVNGLDPLFPLGLEQPEEYFSTTNNNRYRVLSKPIYSNEKFIGTLQVGYDLTAFGLTNNSIIQEMILLILISVLVAVVLIYLVINHELQRIVNITKTINRINHSDDSSLRVRDKGPRADELGELVTGFNTTMERLDNTLISQRRFLADVSHELRTPMTIIKGNVDLMRRFGEFDEESLNTIEAQTDRLTRMVTSLLLLEQVESGRVEIKKTPVNMADLLLEVYQEMILISEYKNQNMQVVEIDLAIVGGNRDQLKQVLLNLVSNAINYTPDGGEIYLSLRKEGTSVRIGIRDTGPGIPDEDVKHIFERFYRSEKSRVREHGQISGFGLGLSIAYWIVRNHNGSIKIDTEVGKGTEFIVYLPLTGSITR